MTFQVAQIDHVEVYVPDRHEAAAWYQQVLGLEIVPDREFWSEDPHGPLMISSDDGSTSIALFAGDPSPSVSGRKASGFYLLAFRVDAEGFRAFLEHARTLGLRDRDGQPLSRASVSDHGKSWSVYFQDPWGHDLEVTTYEQPL